MAIMAMDTVKNTNKNIVVLLPLLLSSVSWAGEWTVDPSVGLSTTYTDNVELTRANHTSSYVSQVNADINATFASRMSNLTLSSTNTYATYTHDHDLDDNYRTLNAFGSLVLWTDGPSLIASSTIANVSRNSTDNSLADLVSGDTVETTNNRVGLQYSSGNSDYSLQTSLMFNKQKSEDSIGESNGYTYSVNSENGSAARNVYWQVNGNYTDRENTGSSGRNYTIDALVGAITSMKLNPFIRYYDEDVTGTIANSNINSTASWGPGIRWLASDHLIVDMSYNFVEDKDASDDYTALSVNWQPSKRTSLLASYNERFFGESYELAFNHKTKRLSNNISYNETLEAFDRDSYEVVELGQLYCPIGATDFSGCVPSSPPPEDVENYNLITLTDRELVQANEFSLNKVLSWRSTLALSRTTFTMRISNRERESLSTHVVDNYFDVGFSASRKLGGRSNVSLDFNFSHNEFDKNNLITSGRNDYYRTISANYSRQLANSLSSNFTLRYLDRNSTTESQTYEELRAVINITKDF